MEANCPGEYGGEASGEDDSPRIANGRSYSTRERSQDGKGGERDADGMLMEMHPEGEVVGRDAQSVFNIHATGSYGGDIDGARMAQC